MIKLHPFSAKALHIIKFPTLRGYKDNALGLSCRVSLRLLNSFRTNTKTSLWLICWLLLVTACSQGADSSPDKAAIRLVFEETGYAVEGEFLTFFEKYGGLDSLGLPLSEEIVVDGWRLQYFEKGRLEYHPENEPAYRVTVGWLGILLNRRRPPISDSLIPDPGLKNYRYFSQTGHTLSGDFLRYYEAHGGSVRFGLPISEPFLEAGQLTQDFESARLFWTPDTAGSVTLEDTGRIHLDLIDHP